MTEAFRTPEERFADLPGFPYEPSYREVDQLRIAHVDMRATCAGGLDENVAAAYDAPFPTPESKAALTGLPLSVPRPESGQIAGADDLGAALRADRRPMIMIWGREDLVLTLTIGERLAASIGRQLDHVVPEAGHGIQEDQGPLVGELIADWLAGRP